MGKLREMLGRCPEDSPFSKGRKAAEEGRVAPPYPNQIRIGPPGSTSEATSHITDSPTRANQRPSGLWAKARTKRKIHDDHDHSDR